MLHPRLEIDSRLHAHMEDEHEHEHDLGGEGCYTRGLRLIRVCMLIWKTSTSTGRRARARLGGEGCYTRGLRLIRVLHADTEDEHEHDDEDEHDWG
jgi:hypothetical protein